MKKIAYPKKLILIGTFYQIIQQQRIVQQILPQMQQYNTNQKGFRRTSKKNKPIYA